MTNFPRVVKSLTFPADGVSSSSTLRPELLELDHEWSVLARLRGHYRPEPRDCRDVRRSVRGQCDALVALVRQVLRRFPLPEQPGDGRRSRDSPVQRGVSDLDERAHLPPTERGNVPVVRLPITLESELARLQFS